MDGLRIQNSVVNPFEGQYSGASTREISSPTLPSSKTSATLQPEGAASFADTLSQAIKQVDQLQKQADIKMQDLSTGRTDNIQDVMMASEKADLALRLMVNVRNKIIEAYQDIMKMQV